LELRAHEVLRARYEQAARRWRASAATAESSGLEDALTRGLVEGLARAIESGDLEAGAPKRLLASLDRPVPLETLLQGCRFVRELVIGLLLEAPAGESERQSWIAGLTGASSALDVLISESLRTELSERERRISELAHFERRFTALFEASPNPLFVTRGGGIVLANPACARLLGAGSPAELVGRSPLELFHSDCHQAIRERFAEIARGGSTPLLRHRIVRLDGQVRDVEVVAAAFADVDGLSVQVVMGDVTDRLKAEQSLRDSEERFRALVEPWAQATWEAAPEGGIVADSPSWRAYTGQSFEAMAGKGWLEAVHPDDRASAERGWRRAIETKRPTSAEFRLRRADGTWCWTNVRASPLLDRDGQVRKWVGINVDVSERRRAEEELREVSQRKTDFLAFLSHELRNPLAPIRNSIHLLERAGPDSEVSARARQVLRRQTDHLTRLVDDLLDIARITHGKLELQLETVDAREIVRRVYADVSDMFAQRGLKLTIAEPAEPLWVKVDASRLAQMVANLVSNALKFTLPGGRVDVSLRSQGGTCELGVADTGVGIDPGDMQRIFQPFAQSERTRHGQGGMGIGLALVRELAERQGGAVRASSPGVGQGAAFVITLPLAVPVERSHAGNGDGSTESLAVLIVKDNADAAATLADVLRLDGHAVEVAATGSEGIEAATTRVPRVLICDIGLPDMSGHDVIRAIRESPSGRGIFAVALTGYAQSQDRDLALAAGFDAHLAKPPAIDQLEGLLRQATERRT
jgi:PAS domain S-box-containing protein